MMSLGVGEEGESVRETSEEDVPSLFVVRAVGAGVLPEARLEVFALDEDVTSVDPSAGISPMTLTLHRT